MDIEWCRIPVGVFKFGTSDTSQAHLVAEFGNVMQNLESSEIRVLLPTYWISKYPITQGQFREFVSITGYQFWAGERMLDNSTLDHPATFLTYRDVMNFCAWGGFRLPTEMEWEKAAKGPSNTIYPWGDEWQEGVCNTLEYALAETTPVNQFTDGQSGYGVMDMSGNVWEYTSSTFASESNLNLIAYSEHLDSNYTITPFLEDSHKEYVCLKGGSTKSNRLSARCAARSGIFLSTTTELMMEARQRWLRLVEVFRCSGRRTPELR